MRFRKIGVPAMMLGTAALVLTGCGVGGSGGSDAPDNGAESSDNIAQQIADVSDDELQGVTVTMARFFGDCNETTNGVTDMEEATTECEAIQILTNKFEAENEWGIKVERLGEPRGTPTTMASIPHLQARRSLILPLCMVRTCPNMQIEACSWKFRVLLV